MRLYRLSVLLCSIAVLLTACHSSPSDARNSIFYYVRLETQYDSQSILVPEERTCPESLGALITQYLSGPLDRNLRSPFPEGTKMEDCAIRATQVDIILSEHAASLTGMQLTVACCALSNTCFANSDALTVNLSAKNALLDGHETLSFTENMLYQ